jgi:hypothetical protein
MHEALNTFDRRAFVVGSALLAASTCVPAFARAGERSSRHLLFDRRYLAHLTAADHMIPHTIFDGDLTHPWVHHLQPLLREGPRLVEGIVSPAALFCLEQLAEGERHRVIARVALKGTGAVRFRIAAVGAGMLS